MVAALLAVEQRELHRLTAGAGGDALRRAQTALDAVRATWRSWPPTGRPSRLPPKVWPLHVMPDLAGLSNGR